MRTLSTLASLLVVTTLGLGTQAFASSPPVVTTLPVGGFKTNNYPPSNWTATVGGTADTDGLTGTGWFRFSDQPFTVCSDSVGTRFPSTWGKSLSPSVEAKPWTMEMGGLAPGKTYHLCAIASNAAGLGFGNVVTFTTPLFPPNVETVGAQANAALEATLEGAVLPYSGPTTAWFRYDTQHPVDCDDQFGIRVPATGGATLPGADTPQPFQLSVAGLAPGQLYYYCAIVENALTRGFGEVRAFRTPSAPTTQVVKVDVHAGTGATVLASGLPNGADTEGWIRYAPTSAGRACTDDFGERLPATGGVSLGSGELPVSFSQTLAGLTPGTTWDVCAFVSNALGTGASAPQVFTTFSLPSVVTSSAVPVAPGRVALHGAARPAGTPAKGWFRLANEAPSACDDSFGTRVPETGGILLGDGVEQVGWAVELSDLSPGETWYFCALASNAVGLATGELLSFTLDVIPPDVHTDAAAEVTADSAVLRGSATPNRSDAEGWFRLYPDAPEGCDDASGLRLPEAGGLALGAGEGPASFSVTATDLLPNVTYAYCAIAANAGGASVGELRSFTTAAEPPKVTTLPARISDDAQVILDAVVNARGAGGEAWFQVGQQKPEACTPGFGERRPLEGVPLAPGHEDLALSTMLEGPAPGTWYYCAVARTDAGLTVGEVLSFEITAPAVSGCGCSTGAAFPWSGALSLLALVRLRARPPSRQRRPHSR